MTRPLCASAISTVTVPATLWACLASVRQDFMSAMNLSRANGGIASIGKLSIITLARVAEGHWTEATLGPATGNLRIMSATAPWNVGPAPTPGAAAAEEAFGAEPLAVAAESPATAPVASAALTVTDCITRLLAASAISTVTGPATWYDFIASAVPDFKSPRKRAAANGGIWSIGKSFIKSRTLELPVH